MPEWVIFVGGILLFVLILSVTVALHEAGHMFAAKKLGLDVPEFSVGFGPKLFGRKGKKTDYNVRALPLGGYVLIQDTTQPEESYERSALSHVAPWKRQIVFAAGPAVNLVLGTVLLMVALMAFPFQLGTTTVDTLQSCEEGAPCGSLQAGLKPGDRIVSIDGIPVNDLDEIAEAKLGKASIDAVVERGEEKLTIQGIKLEPKTSLMGIVVTTADTWRTFPQAWSFVAVTVENNLHALANLPSKFGPIAESIVTGERPEDSPGSVVSIGKTYGDTAVAPEEETGNKLYVYMIYTALFSFGLGFLNLLPLTILDGGRMLIAFMDSCRLWWSKVTKKVYTPTRKTVYMSMAMVSAVVVFGFMGMLILSDFSLIFRGNL